MLNRRKVLFGAAALMAAALPAMPVMASDSRLLADILAGVSDALTRDYIRRHLSGRPLGRQPLELRRPPLHGRRVRPLLDRRLLQALSSASACAPSAAFGSQASASAALRRTGRSSASASAAPAICGRKASGRTGSEATAASARSGPAPAAFRRSRPQAAACRRSASASLRRAGRQGPGRSRRSPLTPLRLNRLRAGHEREIRSR